jgi:hypothetical protein
MADIVFRARYDDSELDKGLQDNVKSVEQVEQALNDVGETGEQAFDKVAASAKGATDQAGRLRKVAPAAIAETGKAADGAGKRVGLLPRIFRSAGLAARGFGKALTAAVVSTGVGAILVAITLAIRAVGQALGRVKPVVDFAADAFAAVSAVVDELIDRALKFADGLGKLFSGDIKGGLASIRDSASGIAQALGLPHFSGADLLRYWQAHDGFFLNG